MARCSLLMIASLLALFGCGKKENLAFKTLTEKAMNDLQIKTSSHQRVWDLGKSERWDLNQSDGNLIFTFPDKIVTCEAQIIGSFDKTQGTWLWSWDNPSVETNLTRNSRWLRDYGTQNKYEKLTVAEWRATEKDAWEMAALATLLCNAQGAYRGPSGDGYVFMTFGPAKIHKK